MKSEVVEGIRLDCWEQNKKVTYIWNESTNRLSVFLSLFNNIEKLNYDDMLVLVKEMVWNYDKFPFFEVKRIEDQILSNNVSFDKQQILILSILVYYINNNFSEDIFSLLWKLFPEFRGGKKQLLKHFIENVNLEIYKQHNIYYLLYARLYVIQDYLFILELEEQISNRTDFVNDNIQISVITFIDNWLNQVRNMVEDDGLNELKLTAVLTILSHINYYLAFIDDRDYLEELLKEFSDNLILLGKKRQDLLKDVSDFHKQVLYAIVSFVISVLQKEKYLSEQIVVFLNNLKQDLKVNLDDISFEMRAFFEDYCGTGKDNVNYSTLVGEKKNVLEKVDAFINSYVLKNITYYHHLIWTRASLLSQYFQSKYNLILDENSISKYNDRIYLKIFNLKEQLHSFLNIDGVLKEFFIRILKLPFNVGNMHIYIKFLNHNFKNIDVEFLKFDESYERFSLSEYEYIVLRNKKWQVGFYLPKDYKKLRDVYESNKSIINWFMDELYEKLIKADKFLEDIWEKVELLKKRHIETFHHMERLWKLLNELIKMPSFIEERKILERVSNYLHVDIDTFTLFLWYLHDIWKADNNLNLQYYNEVNIKSYVLEVLELFLIKLKANIESWHKEKISYFYYKLLNDIISNPTHFNKKLINSINEDIDRFKKYSLYSNLNQNCPLSKDNFNESKENEQVDILDIIKKLEKNKKITDQIITFYNCYRLREFLHLSFSATLENSFKSLIYEVYTTLKELWIKKVKILNSKFRKNFQAYFLDTLERDWILKEEKDFFDIDIYMLALLVVLNKISFYHSKELKEPHILSWERFISKYPDFLFLSWVLIHHIDYPNLQELEEEKILDWLRKWRKIIWKTECYFSEDELTSQNKDKIILDPAKRDIFMVMLTSLDIIDAILSKRNYQWVIFCEYSEKFINPDVMLQLYSYYSDNMFSDINKKFDTVIWWLDNDFKNNFYWSKVKKVLLEKKDEILKFYENKWKK